MTSKLIPPINFGHIEEGLYRCGQPSELNFPYLEKLKLRHIVYLAPDRPSKQFEAFVEDQGIMFHHLGMESRDMLSAISEEVVIEALKITLNPDNYPCAIMCNMGRHRTGTVVGCLRKLQKWTVSSIFEEYRRYAGAKVRQMNEQFIELFDTDLVDIPRNAPKWVRQ